MHCDGARLTLLSTCLEFLMSRDSDPPRDAFDAVALRRRRLLQGAAALPVMGLRGLSFGQSQFPTAKVNTTKLAVTDTEVTVGQLHSSTGTMAISETGSIQAEQLAIDQINAMSARERELTADLLKRICQNRAVIVIEHDMAFVKQIAHKVTVMHQGKILAEGPMEKVQADPKVIDVYLGH